MRCYIGIGSNLGDSLSTMRWAVSQLEGTFGPIQSSLVYKSKAMYDQDQGDFLNMVCAMHTDFLPLEILEELQRIEKESGRIRDPHRPKGPRCLDLDLLYCGGISYQSKRLTLPHPGASERLFVVRPLLDLDPHFVDPQSGVAFKTLAEKLIDQGVYFFASLE
jgi:2-amino-4-hydroxy-6-hydroxymethyldihydropteridine diphosphokinase